ncbi:MAG: response regulator transcription factor [Ignavibacteria bacterium]
MSNSKQISVIIVDDHSLLREGFASRIEKDDTLELIDEAATGEDGLHKICKHKPDVAVVDIELPGINGFELSKKIKECSPNTEIIILTSYKQEEYFREAMEIGVSGYFLKDETIDILKAIKNIISGEPVISPKVLSFVTNLYSKRNRFRENVPDLQKLTNREREILKLLSVNKSNNEISNELCIDKRTVETHRNNIREKLGLIGGSRNALLVFALENKEILT